MKTLFALCYLSLSFTTFAAEADKPNEDTTQAPLRLNLTSAQIQQQSGLIVGKKLKLDLDRDTKSYAGFISSAGCLTKMETGTLHLHARRNTYNTYTGTTIIHAGTLTLADNAEILTLTGNPIPVTPMAIPALPQDLGEASSLTSTNADATYGN